MVLMIEGYINLLLNTTLDFLKENKFEKKKKYYIDIHSNNNFDYIVE